MAKVEELLALCDELEARQTAAREHRTRLVRSALDHLTTAKDEKDFRKHSAFVLNKQTIFLILSMFFGRRFYLSPCKAISCHTIQVMRTQRNLLSVQS